MHLDCLSWMAVFELQIQNFLMNYQHQMWLHRSRQTINTHQMSYMRWATQHTWHSICTVSLCRLYQQCISLQNSLPLIGTLHVLYDQSQAQDGIFHFCTFFEELGRSWLHLVHVPSLTQQNLQRLSLQFDYRDWSTTIHLHLLTHALWIKLTCCLQSSWSS